MSFTKGPWRIPTPSMGFSKIEGPNGELIFGLAVGWDDEKQPDDVCEANARLVAAAPALVEALEALLEPWKTMSDEALRENGESNMGCRRALHARAALRLARGE